METMDAPSTLASMLIFGRAAERGATRWVDCAENANRAPSPRIRLGDASPAAPRRRPIVGKARPRIASPAGPRPNAAACLPRHRRPPRRPAEPPRPRRQGPRRGDATLIPDDHSTSFNWLDATRVIPSAAERDLAVFSLANGPPHVAAAQRVRAAAGAGAPMAATTPPLPPRAPTPPPPAPPASPAVAARAALLADLLRR